MTTSRLSHDKLAHIDALARRPDVLFFGGLGDNDRDYRLTSQALAEFSIIGLGIQPDFAHPRRGALSRTTIDETRHVLDALGNRFGDGLTYDFAGISLGGAEAVLAAHALEWHVGNVTLVSPAGIGTALWERPLGVFNSRRREHPPAAADDGLSRASLNQDNQRLHEALLRSDDIIRKLAKLASLHHRISLNFAAGDHIFPLGEALTALKGTPGAVTFSERYLDDRPHASLSSSIGRSRFVSALR